MQSVECEQRQSDHRDEHCPNVVGRLRKHRAEASKLCVSHSDNAAAEESCVRAFVGLGVAIGSVGISTFSNSSSDDDSDKDSGKDSDEGSDSDSD